LVGLATDTPVYLSRRGEALKFNKSTFIIRTSDSSWHPGLPGRPLIWYSASLHMIFIDLCVCVCVCVCMCVCVCVCVCVCMCV